MKDPLRILYISQEIYPFIYEETPTRLINRKLPEACQSAGWETRTFMPKFGEINERRNMLHEVIRLSGMNIIIDDTDHPLLLKVASIQSARIQIYFIDNDDFFNRRRGTADANGKEFADNDERCIFFARGVIETIKKLRWTPNIIQCSGWMSALAPLYLKTAYADTPFFTHSKIVYSLNESSFKTAFSKDFSQKLLIEGVKKEHIADIAEHSVSHNDLMKLAIKYSDAVVQSTPTIDKKLKSYAQNEGKMILEYPGEETQPYIDFYHQLLSQQQIPLNL